MAKYQYEDRLTDIGPPLYKDMLPPVIAKNLRGYLDSFLYVVIGTLLLLR